MNPRRDFLIACFRIFEQQQVPYCVLRNYDDIYTSLSSDVDLVVEPEALDSFRRALAEAAAGTGHQLVLTARYTNYSQVYWHPEGGFIRVDFETEIRWRIFPLLSAKAVVGRRRKYQEFYIPHPRHESVILFSAALWRKSLSERYAGQLRDLYAQIGDREELNRTFRAAFGGAGAALAECQSRLESEKASLQLLKQARRAVALEALRNGPKRRAMLEYQMSDLRRIWPRLRTPAGFSLLYVSSAQPARTIQTLLEPMEFLAPRSKMTLRNHQLFRSATGSTRLSCRIRLERLRTLLKGGLFLRVYELGSDSELPRSLSHYTRYLYPGRTFVCAENTRHEITMAHVGTGFMAEIDSNHTQLTPPQRVIRFIALILKRQQREPERPPTRGLFVVLLGLDGSGKTTVARRLSCLLCDGERFDKVRYFHWRPSLRKGSTFPIADGRNVPRKRPLRPSLLNKGLSVLRLLKNMILTRLAWRLRVRGLLRRGTLVLLDRYYYNYYLDPASVRYAGPRWFVEKVRKAYPRPDLIVVLKADPAALLARKQELTETEIQAQSQRLEQLVLDAPHTMVVDATKPADEIAREILARIEQIASPSTKPSAGLNPESIEVLKH